MATDGNSLEAHCTRYPKGTGCLRPPKETDKATRWQDHLSKVPEGVARMKKALDVTTKGWSEDTIEKPRQKLIDQGMKYKIQIKMPDGTIKWLYARQPDDIQPYCEQVEATIIKVEDF